MPFIFTLRQAGLQIRHSKKTQDKKLKEKSGRICKPALRQIDLKGVFFHVPENITRTRMAQDLGLISRRGIERLLRGEGSALTTLDGGRYAHQPEYFRIS